MNGYLSIPVLLVGLAGCAFPDRAGPGDLAVPAGPDLQVAPPGGGRTAATLDTTTPAERAAALAQPAAASETDLGRMVVALGSPAEAGFWLSAVAVDAPGKGRVVTAGGQSVAVELRPGTGGALLSLAAFRALGLGLTDLPEVRVYANQAGDRRPDRGAGRGG